MDKTFYPPIRFVFNLSLFSFLIWAGIIWPHKSISYVLSILLTVLRLTQYRRIILVNKKLGLGHVEMEADARNQCFTDRSSYTSSSFRSPGFPTESVRPTIQDLIPVTYRSRISQETTSSYHSDAASACDGLRGTEEPPAYHSRPNSLYSFKGD